MAFLFMKIPRIDEGLNVKNDKYVPIKQVVQINLDFLKPDRYSKKTIHIKKTIHFILTL